MSTRAKRLLLILWAGLAVFGLVGLFMRFTVGRELTNYGSYVPWGLWVSAYIYFIGLSAGAFLISSLIYVFRFEKLRPVGRLALFTAAITLLMSLVAIWFDLGQMWRFWEIFTRPNFHSMMAWMVWLYTAYFFLILAELWFEMRCDLSKRGQAGGRLAGMYRILALGWRCPTDEVEFAACHARNQKALRVLGGIGVPLAIAFHGGVGALFATLASRPYWHHSLFPILFLTGALVSGGALLLALIAMTSRDHDRQAMDVMHLLAKIVLGLLIFDLVLEWSETTIPMWYGIGSDFELYKEILFGRFWYVFWIAHLLIGSLIPAVLILTKPNSRRATGLAGILIAVTFLAVRLNLVIPGQVEPALEGLRTAYVDHRLSFDYVPSLFEWSVVALIVAGGMVVFRIGYRYLPLVKRAEEEVPA